MNKQLFHSQTVTTQLEINRLDRRRSHYQTHFGLGVRSMQIWGRMPRCLTRDVIRLTPQKRVCAAPPSRSTLILVSSCISTVSTTPCLWSIPDTPCWRYASVSQTFMWTSGMRALGLKSNVLAVHYRPGALTERQMDGFLQLSYLGEAVMWAVGASGSQV